MAIPLPAVGDKASASWADAVAAAINAPVLGDVSTSAAVTLATAATDVAGTAQVTFTLPVQTRVKISVVCRYLLGSTTAGRAVLQAAYNSGGAAAIGSVVKIGAFASSFNNSAIIGATGASSVTTFATVLLAPGTYTAYGAVQRGSGGSASDTASVFGTLVEAVGFQ